MKNWKIIGGLACFYLTFAFFYMLSLKYSWAGNVSNWQIIYVDYPLKALITVPVWWLVFKKWQQSRLAFRIALTMLLLPVWTKAWQQLYYFIDDTLLGGGHLVGPAEWWDIYIPALFYCIQFGVFFAVEYYQNFKRTELAKVQSEQLALAGELGALKAQLNPHFLYNAFNTINASVPAGQETTRELIARLSDMFRYQLKTSHSEQISLGDELAFIRDYLELEGARYGSRLKVDIEVEPGLEQAAIPPLILQPLVENAVRHGISPMLEGGRITLLARKQQGKLQLSVIDTGVGYDSDKAISGQGVGLSNTRRRLELLYASELHISTPATGGTRISFTIPLHYVANNSAHRRRKTRPEPIAGIPG